MKKRLLYISVPLLLLTVGCDEINSSLNNSSSHETSFTTSEDNSSATSSIEEVKPTFESEFLKLQKGFKFSGLNSESKTSGYNYGYVNFAITNENFNVLLYEQSSEEATKDKVYNELKLTRHETNSEKVYAAKTGINLNNEIIYFDTNIEWENIDMLNFFNSLSSNNFTKLSSDDEEVYSLNVSNGDVYNNNKAFLGMSNVLATYNLASQTFNKDLDITELKVTFADEKIKSFVLKGNDIENNINYSLEANIDSYGENAIEGITSYTDGTKDALLEKYLEKLRKQEYTANGQFIPSTGATNVNARTFRVVMTDNGNVCSVENYKKGNLSGTLAKYNGINYKTDDNKIATIVKIGDKFYQNGEAVEGEIFTPSFNISSIFFKRTISEDNVTTFELNNEYPFYVDSKTDIISPLFTFSNLFEKSVNSVSNLVITIDENNNSIEFKNDLVYSSTKDGSTHIKYTFDKAEITLPNKDEIITNINKSTWKDLFIEKENLYNGLVTILKSEETLNKLPIPSSNNPLLELSNREKDEDSEYPSYSVITVKSANAESTVEEYKNLLLNNNFIADPSLKCYWSDTSALKLTLDETSDLVVEIEKATNTSTAMYIHVYLNLK